MILLTPQQRALLSDRVDANRPGPMVGSHVINTGNGALWVDHWPDPRAILAETGGNYSLWGDPQALPAAMLRERIRGFVDAPLDWVPVLERAFPAMHRWQRVILELPARAYFAVPGDYVIRRLGAADAGHVGGLSTGAAWIAKTWSSAAGLAAGGYARGAFADGRLVSIACTFFVGRSYEDLGVVTESGFEGHGLSTACAGALCEDIRQRGPFRGMTRSTALGNKIETTGRSLIAQQHRCNVKDRHDSPAAEQDTGEQRRGVRESIHAV